MNHPPISPARPTRRAVLRGAALLGATALAGCTTGPQQPGPSSTTTPPGPKPTSLSDLLATDPFYIAHRGGSANWPEMTLAAYERAVDAGLPALEVSVFRSADGVFVCSHDPDLQRVTGQNITIADTAWSTLRTIEVQPPDTAEPGTAPAPLARIEEVLDRFLDTHVLFIEDKTYQSSAPLLELIGGYPRATEQVVWKVFGSSGSAPIDIGAQAGLTTWGYWFADGMANFAQEAQRFDLVGVDYACNDEQLQQAADVGKPMIGHIVRTAQQRDRLLAAGCQGIMLADVEHLAPR